jgi:CRP/FNR family cyclic AMP-dependent transcriptional regulator
MLTSADIAAALILTMPYTHMKIADYIDEGKKVKLFKGEEVFSKVKSIDDIYYIYVDKGQIAVTITLDQVTENLLLYCNPGNTFVVEYNIPSEIVSVHNVSFTATRDSVIYGFTQRHIYEIMKNDPEIFYELSKSSQMSYMRLAYQLAYRNIHPAMQRLRTWLSKLCQVFSPDADGIYTIECDISHHQLSELLSIHPSTCSRLLTTLGSEGVARITSKGIIIYNRERLGENPELV